jgi:hypothetical protein
LAVVVPRKETGFQMARVQPDSVMFTDERHENRNEKAVPEKQSTVNRYQPPTLGVGIYQNALFLPKWSRNDWVEQNMPPECAPPVTPARNQAEAMPIIAADDTAAHCRRSG